jgi:hypothetical protein
MTFRVLSLPPSFAGGSYKHLTKPPAPPLFYGQLPAAKSDQLHLSYGQTPTPALTEELPEFIDVTYGIPEEGSPDRTTTVTATGAEPVVIPGFGDGGNFSDKGNIGDALGDGIGDLVDEHPQGNAGTVRPSSPPSFFYGETSTPTPTPAPAPAAELPEFIDVAYRGEGADERTLVETSDGEAAAFPGHGVSDTHNIEDALGSDISELVDE